MAESTSKEARPLSTAVQFLKGVGPQRAAKLARLDREVEMLERELRRATGLGGRDRRAGKAAERARVNVQRRLRDAVKRIREQEPKVAAQVERALRTGTHCVYRSKPPS